MHCFADTGLSTYFTENVDIEDNYTNIGFLMTC